MTPLAVGVLVALRLGLLAAGGRALLRAGRVPAGAARTWLVASGTVAVVASLVSL